MRMERIVKASGSTTTERALSKICEETFLSLWSYPNLYTPEGRKHGRGVGKELCDLLAVFGNHVILFSDKEVSFNSEKEVGVAWARWRRKAIADSAKQLYGAEKWIRERPEEVYVDKFCNTRLPVQLPRGGDLKIHLVAVTKGSYFAAKEHFGGMSTGSLMLIPSLTEEEANKFPFTANDIAPGKTFVHVFDEMTLNIVLGELDTASDLIKYLSDKESAIRSGRIAAVPGEEDLIAFYMRQRGLMEENPFGIPHRAKLAGYQSISLIEGFWQDYLSSPERDAIKQANRISYFWDKLIEQFSEHILAGSVAVGKDAPFSSHELAIRYMAAEGRLARCALSHAFLDKMRSVPSNMRSARVCFSPFNKDRCFVLVLFPKDDDESYESYREDRISILHSYGYVCKLNNPQARIISVIGTEPQGASGRSEDILCLEIEHLSEEEAVLARQIQREGNILNDVTMIENRHSLAPIFSSGPSRAARKVGRNEPCPCGSGKKYKKCCI